MEPTYFGLDVLDLDFNLDLDLDLLLSLSCLSKLFGMKPMTPADSADKPATCK